MTHQQSVTVLTDEQKERVGDVSDLDLTEWPAEGDEVADQGEAEEGVHDADGETTP